MDFSYSISGIAEITQGNIIKNNDSQEIISDLIIDSRKFVGTKIAFCGFNYCCGFDYDNSC